MKKRTFKAEMKLNLAEPALNKNNTLGCEKDYTQHVIMIVNEETKQKFFVNTQGYSYARYCLFN